MEYEKDFDQCNPNTCKEQCISKPELIKNIGKSVWVYCIRNQFVTAMDINI